MFHANSQQLISIQANEMHDQQSPSKPARNQKAIFLQIPLLYIILITKFQIQTGHTTKGS